MIPPHVPTLPFTTGVADLGERVFHGSSGARVPLTDVEVRLLGYLAGRGVVGRDQLLREVWGWSARAVSRTVDTAVWRLRQKVEADPSSPEHLLTAPGGWRLQLLAPAPEAPVGVVRREGLRRALAEAAGRGGWVSVVGPGGAGKTTLLRDLAAERGAAVVSLAGCASLGALVAAVAGQAGWTAVDELPALVRALAGRGGLLLLDDLDAGVGPARELQRALAAGAPAVTVVATSRERLATPGEQLVAVPGMTPAEARALFDARRVDGGGDAWSDDAAVGRVLAAVDHLPLAVELVAGWIDVMGPADLLTRLEGSLELLAGGPVDLRRVVAASWALLGDDARGGLLALAAFEDGFTLAEAEQVAPRAAAALREGVRRSLVQRDGESYRLWAAVRAFARELGVPASASAALRAALAADARAWRDGLDTPARPALLRAAERRRRDLLSAAAGAAGDGDPAAAPLALVLAHLPGHLDDRIAALERAARVAEGDLELPAVLAALWKGRGRPDEARRVLAAVMPRAAGSPRWRAELLLVAGVVERDHGEPAAAERALDEALALARALPDGALLTARALVDRAWLHAGQGRTRDAEAAYHEALELLPASLPARRAPALANLANLHRETGRDPLPLLVAALDAHVAVANRQGEGVVAGSIAAHHTERGDPDAALAWFESRAGRVPRHRARPRRVGVPPQPRRTPPPPPRHRRRPRRPRGGDRGPRGAR